MGKISENDTFLSLEPEPNTRLSWYLEQMIYRCITAFWITIFSQVLLKSFETTSRRGFLYHLHQSSDFNNSFYFTNSLEHLLCIISIRFSYQINIYEFSRRVKFFFFTLRWLSPNEAISSKVSTFNTLASLQFLRSRSILTLDLFLKVSNTSIL